MGFLFEKLDVYQRAVEFADKTFSVAGGFPRGQSVISDQLKRAALSIPLNIAEGCGRWHKKDKKQFYLISRGSAFECVAAISICKSQSLIDHQTCDELKDDLNRLCQMLTKLVQSMSQ